MSENLKHIEGIYNYCDRWCERCSHTSRCAVYERIAGLSPEENDVNNKAFWESIARSLEEAFSLVLKVAEEQGISFPAEDEKEIKSQIANLNEKRQAMEQHPLIKYCKQYSLAANEFLKNSDELKQKADTQKRLAEIGVKNIDEAKEEIIQISEYFEIIQWYLFQVQVKFMRSMSIFEEEEQDESLSNDSLGSAKVALLATDRSMVAWYEILQWLPEAEDSILPLLALLQKIRTLGEQTFPEARKFVRVGLDEAV